MDKYAETREFEICPYNSSHRVEKGTRFQSHLVACSQNYPDMETVHCPFNYTHLIKKPELRYHLLYCPDSDGVKKKMVNIPSTKKFVPPVLPLTTEPLAINERGLADNWDGDQVIARQIVNPSLTSYTSNHIINTDSLSGLKKAQKKKIRQNIARGLNAFHDEDYLYPNPIEQPEPPEPPKPVLKEIPLPKQQPETTKIGSHRSQTLPNRIAANIFPGMPPTSTIGYTPPPPGIRPPPGLMSQSGGFNRPPFYPLPLFTPEMVDGRRMHNFGRGMINYRDSSEDNIELMSNKWSQSMTSLDAHMSAMSLVSGGDGDGASEVESKGGDEVGSEVTVDEEKKGGGDKKEEDEENEDEREWMEQVYKRKRRLEKKLRQIESLESKLKHGELLNMEEMVKISKKCELVEQTAPRK